MGTAAGRRPILVATALLALVGTGIVDLDAFLPHADAPGCADDEATPCAHAHCCAAHHVTLFTRGVALPGEDRVGLISPPAEPAPPAGLKARIFRPPLA